VIHKTPNKVTFEFSDGTSETFSATGTGPEVVVEARHFMKDWEDQTGGYVHFHTAVLKKQP
jgi:hypothetical protein